MAQFFGKHQGKVVNNRDPLGLGPLKVRVPSIYEKEADEWALPCLAYAVPSPCTCKLQPLSCVLLRCGVACSGGVWSVPPPEEGGAGEGGGDGEEADLSRVCRRRGCRCHGW